MVRDYKNTGRGKSAKPAPRWVWMGIGLLPGLFIALMVYLSGYTLESAEKVARSPSVNTPAREKADARSVRKMPEATIPEPPSAPRFDFYTILPEMEVAVPEHELADEVAQAPVAQPGSYILQAGSFKSFAEADRLKASLILLGIGATIQTVSIDNKDTWHRVQIGPYQNLSELNRVRERLKQHHIEVVLLRIKA
jgi:cell division protein FtsN